jgi:hypothetical protein
MMHVPTARPACHTPDATARLWKYDKRLMSQAAVDHSRMCQAWPSRKVLEQHQGCACDGCARLPEDIAKNDADVSWDVV